MHDLMVTLLFESVRDAYGGELSGSPRGRNIQQREQSCHQKTCQYNSKHYYGS